MTISKYEAAKNLAYKLDTSLLNYTFNIQIRRVYTDVAGIVQDKNTVATALQVKYPVYMFGEMDRMGGYAQALANCPPQSGTYYLMSFINGVSATSASVIGFTGTNEIQSLLQTGDIVHVFTDSVQIPSVYIWIIQTANRQALGSIMGNTKTTRRDDKYNRMWVERITYTTSNQNNAQWNEPIHETRLDNLALSRDDSYTATMFREPTNEQDKLLLMRIPFYVDQFIGWNTYIQFATEQIQLIFHIKK